MENVRDTRKRECKERGTTWTKKPHVSAYLIRLVFCLESLSHRRRRLKGLKGIRRMTFLYETIYE